MHHRQLMTVFPRCVASWPICVTTATKAGVRSWRTGVVWKCWCKSPGGVRVGPRRLEKTLVKDFRPYCQGFFSTSATATQMPSGPLGRWGSSV